jgi:hypothetical protein
MGLHQILRLLHSKGNNYHSEATTYRMRENFANYLSDKEFNIQNILRTQKFKH